MDRERFLQQVAYLRERRCHPYGAALAYGPIVELLKQQFQIATSDRDEDIRGKIQQGLAALSTALAAAPRLRH